MKRNCKDSVRIIDSGILNDNLNYQDSQGTDYENIVRDILFHVINHSNYHRAQIVSNLKEAGLHPGKTDFIYYKR